MASIDTSIRLAHRAAGFADGMAVVKSGSPARSVSALRVVVTVLAACLTSPSAATATPKAPPNVVVITTDDQTVADLKSMPLTQRLIGAEGVSFTDSVVSLSQCCPSRATLLTGRYAHNHGVLSTSPPFGGFAAFDPSESLAVWLQRAGYATALVGKYLNGYARDGPAAVPPGWSEWHALTGPTTYDFFDFAISHGGGVERYEGRYQSDVLTGLAEDVIHRRADARRPLFLWMSYVAPHAAASPPLQTRPRLRSATPSPMFANALLAARPHRSAAFDEADVTDKPAAIRRRPRLGPGIRLALDAVWRQRQTALTSVDGGVARLVRALRDVRALDRTLLIFTSDNGFLIGEHRVRTGKVLPYEPSIRVPLLVRGPGVPPGERRGQLVFNGDLAPTILEAAGGRALRPLDGSSLWPSIRSREAPSRQAVLLEAPPLSRRDSTPRFTGLRTRRQTYVEHATGEVELYNLQRDPDQLTNLAHTPAAARIQSALARRLQRLRGCSGRACRTPPPRPSGRR